MFSIDRSARIGRLAAILALVVAPSVGSAVDAAAPHGPTFPLSLRVSLATPEAIVGEPASVTYRLTNETDEAFSGCADDWGAGVWWGPAGIRETAIDKAYSCPPAGHFSLAPHATRMWTSDVKVLNVGLGEGHFVGVVRYSGDSWSGQARSATVAVVFRDPHAKR
jgi:hypothetical protein